MDPDFDQPVERQGTDSIKWKSYGAGVLPMWVADMDFRSPPPVVQALRERAEHGVFGYAAEPAELSAVLCERMYKRYGWEVLEKEIVYFPGVVAAINLACRTLAGPGEGVLVQTPVYPPFLSAPPSGERLLQTAPLREQKNDHTLRYEIDYDVFEASLTPETRLFILCNPHNPTGNEFSPDQVQRLAEICLRHNVLIISDEIHCELLLDGTQHKPTASLAPEISEHCITLMAPSKTFNLPGLGCSFAIVQNEDLRKRLKKAGEGIMALMNVMGLAAALAAYREGDEWLAALLAYLTTNRNFLVSQVSTLLPGIRTTVPQATYLAWLDCRDAGIGENPFGFFLQRAAVGLGDGSTFGFEGKGFVRLNFGCPRAQLREALERMRAALTDWRLEAAAE